MNCSIPPARRSCGAPKNCFARFIRSYEDAEALAISRSDERRLAGTTRTLHLFGIGHNQISRAGRAGRWIDNDGEAHVGAGAHSMLTVVAALIAHEGRLLVCQRHRKDTFALQWEFPGGKVRAGETLVSALARELQEELGARARIGAEVFRTRHSYRELPDQLELIFFTAQVDPDAIRNLAFEQMQWVEPAKLPAMNFLPADRELIAKLASGALPLNE